MNKLGIIAGGGRLPALLIEHMEDQSAGYFVLTFKNQPKPHVRISESFPTVEVPLGAVSKAVDVLKEQGVTHVVMAGHLNKTSIFDLRLDKKAFKLLSKLKSKNDNRLLSAICDLLAGEGFTVLGAHEVLPELLAPTGFLTKKEPDQNQTNDIHIGHVAAKSLGVQDIGQSIVVKDGVVLGVEAIEGTDALIERCAQLRKGKGGGTLVKCSKPEQNVLVDLPTVGLSTIEKLIAYNYDGLVVEAGRTFILDRKACVELANKKGLFIMGYEG